MLTAHKDTTTITLPSEKFLEAKEGPLNLGHLPRLGGHSNGPGLLPEGHIARGLSQGVVVGDGLDPTLPGHRDVAGIITKVNPYDGHYACSMELLLLNDNQSLEK